MYDKVAYVLMLQDHKGEWYRDFSCYTQKGIINYIKERDYTDDDHRIEVWDRGVLEVCQLVDEMYGHHYW